MIRDHQHRYTCYCCRCRLWFFRSSAYFEAVVRALPFPVTWCTQSASVQVASACLRYRRRWPPCAYFVAEYQICRSGRRWLAPSVLCGCYCLARGFSAWRHVSWGGVWRVEAAATNANTFVYWRHSSLRYTPTYSAFHSETITFTVFKYR